jgi:hypothetical protein
MKKIDLGEYLLLARPCVDITLESAQNLAERAKEEKLDFIGIVYENVGMPENEEFDTIMDLSEKPKASILIRDVGAGLYNKDFLSKKNITLMEDEYTTFPDIDVLWRTFIWAKRAMFVNASVCEAVSCDTIWIDDINMAYHVNMRYDFIRDVLMQDFQVWEKYKTCFSLQRWRLYYEILHWMTEDVAWDFAERMAVEFHRSYELDEMDSELFTAEEGSALYMLAKDPGFLKRYYLGKVILNKKMFDTKNDMRRELDMKQGQITRLEKTLEDTIIQKDEERQRQIDFMNQQFAQELEAQKNKYETSTTFRVGKIIMFVPTSVKNLLLKKKNNPE